MLVVLLVLGLVIGIVIMNDTEDVRETEVTTVLHLPTITMTTGSELELELGCSFQIEERREGGRESENESCLFVIW